MRRRRETEVRERAAYGGRLGVLETGDGVDVAVTDALGRETGGGRSLLAYRPEDERLHGDLVPGSRDEPSEDAPGGVAGVEQRDAVGNRRVLACVQPQLVLRHWHLPSSAPTRQATAGETEYTEQTPKTRAG